MDELEYYVYQPETAKSAEEESVDGTGGAFYDGSTCREYELLYCRPDGSKFYCDQRMLRAPKSDDGTPGLGLLLAEECGKDGKNYNQSDEYGLSCTCVKPHIPLTLYKIPSRKYDNVFHTGIRTHHNPDMMRHRKDCIFYGDKKVKGDRAKHINPETGNMVYRLSIPRKREKTPAASKDDLQEYNPQPDNIRRRPANPTVSISSYFRENAIIRFAQWNRYERGKKEFLPCLYKWLVENTEVRDKVTLGEDLKNDKFFSTLNLAFLTGFEKVRSNYGEHRYYKAVLKTRYVYNGEWRDGKISVPIGSFNAAEGHFKDSYRGADLASVLHRNDIHILVCCRTPNGEQRKREGNKNAYKCAWLTFLLTDRLGLPADSVFEAEVYNAVDDAIAASGKKIYYYYKPIGPENEYGSDRDIFCDAYLARKGNGAKVAAIEAFGLNDAEYLKTKELKKSCCVLPLLYVDAYDEAHGMEAFVRSVKGVLG